MMPNGMNGIELALVARQLYPDIKTILASSYALPTLMTQHSALKAFPFVSKPYRMADVEKKLRSA
jgi:CheY-like chemotaxis protein